MFANNIKLQSNTNYQCIVYFLHNYYPVKRFSWNSLDFESANFRSNLFKFKNGTSQIVTHMFAQEIIEAINRLAPNFNSSDYAFLAVPASTEDKTTKRYSLLLEILKQQFLRATFLNDYVTFTGERPAQHLSKNRIEDISGHFYMTGDVSGKTVIIFDDITTTGRSMADMKYKLKLMGATGCICLSLGKTVGYRIC